MASLCRSSHLSRDPVPRVDHGTSYTITSMGLPCLHQFSSWVLRSERKKGLSQKLHPSDWIVSTSQPNQHFHNSSQKNNHSIFWAIITGISYLNVAWQSSIYHLCIISGGNTSCSAPSSKWCVMTKHLFYITAWCKKIFPLFEIPASFLPSKMASPCTANWPWRNMCH